MQCILYIFLISIENRFTIVMSLCPSVCMSVCLPLFLSVCLFVCLFERSLLVSTITNIVQLTTESLVANGQSTKKLYTKIIEGSDFRSAACKYAIKNIFNTQLKYLRKSFSAG